MKLTVLGKYGPYAPPGGATSGYLMENGGEYVLLDMGSGVLARLQEFIQPSQLKGIIVSHVHYDHINDLFLYKYMLEGLNKQGKLERPVPVAGPSALWKQINSPVFEFVPIDACPEINLAGMKISFALMKHPVASYAMRLKGEGDMVYSGDCNSSGALADFALGCGQMLCDIGTPRGLWTPDSPHMHATQAAQAARSAGASLILTHFMPGMAQAELLEETQEFCGAVCAEEYSCYEL